MNKPHVSAFRGVASLYGGCSYCTTGEQALQRSTGKHVIVMSVTTHGVNDTHANIVTCFPHMLDLLASMSDTVGNLFAELDDEGESIAGYNGI